MVINIPPAPFKGGDVMVSIHEQHSSIIYLIFGLLLVIYTSIFIRLSFANPSLIVRSSCIVPISNVEGKWQEKNFLLIGKFAN